MSSTPLAFLAQYVDSVFLTPFVTGLPLAVLLPLLGNYLRLRDEWLAALAFAQVAAAGSLLAMSSGLPLMTGGVLAAIAAAFAKGIFGPVARGARDAAYAMLLLAGWSVSVLLVANLPLAERLGRALFDGQLYFVDRQHLLVAAGALILGGAVLRCLSRALLRGHFYPDFHAGAGRATRRTRLAFDLLVAVALAVATMSVGVMAAFALIFVPPLLAWHWAGNWRHGLWLSAGAGMLAYVAAFALALAVDQPFGPVLVGVLLGMGAVSSVVRRPQLGRQRGAKGD